MLLLLYVTACSATDTPSGTANAPSATQSSSTATPPSSVSQTAPKNGTAPGQLPRAATSSAVTNSSADPDNGAPPSTSSSNAAPSPETISAGKQGSRLPPRLARKLDGIVRAAVRRGDAPGAVVVLLRGGRIIHQRAYGKRSLQPAAEPMQLDTVFDAASLTKPIVTATLVMQLAAAGRLSLSDPIAKHLPAFRRPDKRAITIAQLLSHTGGLPAANALSDFAEPKLLLDKIAAKPLAHTPGSRRLYSDVGYIVLGQLLEKVSGKPLARLARKRVLSPLGMRDSSFMPATSLAQRAAPTEKRKGRWLRGQVHDPRAAALGGVAGHAGLFTTAEDMARYAQMLLAAGRWQGRTLLPREQVRRMTHTAVPASHHTLAFFRVDGGYGHTGFTGTSLWLDPVRGDGAIVLTSRLHPRGHGDVTQLRREVRRFVIGLRTWLRPAVRPGIDVLAEDGLKPLGGRRVGLITHTAARSWDGRRSVDVLHAAPQLDLVALFSPEHGLSASAEGLIDDSRDRATGLPIHSLYGKQRRLRAADMRGIDTLVVDLQDAGARFYTYLTTLGYVLEAGAKHRKRVVVLDRPNPIGGTLVEGPMLDADRTSFIGYHRLPVRHGMTLGELAHLLNSERNIGADLQVIKMRGAKRQQLFADTGLRWHPPSPNLRSAEAALLYPGLALLEATNVSVGRGTDTPFRQIGAPWLNAAALKEALDQNGPPGVTSEIVRFTPDRSTHRGKLCHGLRFSVTDPRQLRAVHLGLSLIHQLLRQHRRTFSPKNVLTLLGNRVAYQSLLSQKPPKEIIATSKPDLDAFLKIRNKYLLY